MITKEEAKRILELNKTIPQDMALLKQAIEILSRIALTPPTEEEVEE